MFSFSLSSNSPSESTKSPQQSSSSSSELWIPYSNILQLERKLTLVRPTLEISTRDFLCVHLMFKNELEIRDVYLSIQSILASYTPDNVQQQYAFNYHPVLPYSFDGWKLYDPISEYDRLGVGSPGNAWRLSSSNSSYAISPTYPRVLVVPSKISDTVLFHASKFRSRGRLPCLTYIHSANRATITRSSQPLVGLKAKRSIQDEKLVESIFESNTVSVESLNSPLLPSSPMLTSSNRDIPSTSLSTVATVTNDTLTLSPKPSPPSYAKLNLIIDARPIGNAMANRAMGAGTESTEHYRKCKRLFMGIENIHIMRDSQTKFVEAFSESYNSGSGNSQAVERFYGAIDSSSWFKHIRTILDSASLILDKVKSGGNVLIHCSDGWDRTAQLSSLASICLDPYYRTLKGFEALIEKEWLSFGHKFAERLGHYVHYYKSQGNSKKEQEMAPVFLQFIECVSLIIQHYPDQFEYDGRLLVYIYKHAQQCQFGTFLLTCEQARVNARLSEFTQSIWSAINEFPNDFLNHMYEPSSSVRVLWIPSAPKDLKYWKDLYSRYDDEVFPADRTCPASVEDAIDMEANHLMELKDIEVIMSKCVAVPAFDLNKWMKPMTRVDSCPRCKQYQFPRDHQIRCRYCADTMCRECCRYRCMESQVRICYKCFKQQSKPTLNFSK